MTNDDNHVANGICPSPSGEVRWGLMLIFWVTCSFPLGRLGWVILRGRLGGGWSSLAEMIGIVTCSFPLGRSGWVWRLGWVLEREGADSKTPCPIWIKSNEDTGRCHLLREWTTVQNGLVADIDFTCLPPSCRLRCKYLVGVLESLSGSCSCLLVFLSSYRHMHCLYLP